MSRLLENIMTALNQIASVDITGDSIRVMTHCTYPSNGLVAVTIRGEESTFVVSDEGGAVAELHSAGVEIQQSPWTLAHHAEALGVAYSNGVLHSGEVAITELPTAILAVANASKDFANYLFGHTKLRRRRDFRRMVNLFLIRKFERQVLVETELTGHNKAHKFENIIRLDSGVTLVVDSVQHDNSSMYARIVANLDLRKTGRTDIEQRIVYDDSEPWSPSDINLLTIGAPVVPFSMAGQALEEFLVAA